MTVTTAKTTIVELDLAGYGDIARILEESTSAAVTGELNDQIQDFVDAGLASVGIPRNTAVFANTGDGALLSFDRAEQAFLFAEALHRSTERHNSVKTEPSAKRWFRIGAATGEISFRRRPDGGTDLVAGTAIARAVRLEGAAVIGELVVDSTTYDELPPQFRARFGSEEQIPGKRGEVFPARRCIMIPSAQQATESPLQVISDLFEKLNPPDQMAMLLLLIEMPPDHQPSKTLSLAERKAAILAWSAKKQGGLQTLEAALVELIRGQSSHPH